MPSFSLNENTANYSSDIEGHGIAGNSTLAPATGTKCTAAETVPELIEVLMQ